MSIEESHSIGNLEKEIQNIALKLSALPTRDELERILASKVNLDKFEALAIRVAKIESSPSSVREWIGAGVGCFGLLISMIAISITVISMVATHWK